MIKWLINITLLSYKTITNISKGKFFDIEISSSKNTLGDLEKISSDLLSNPIIENFKIIKK